MGFVDSFKCCSSRPGAQPTRRPRRPLAAGPGAEAGGAPPAFVWLTIDEVGQEIKRVPIGEMRPGTRYYSEDGRHFAKDSEGNLAISRPGDNEGAVISEFDQWLAGQARRTGAVGRQQEAHLDLGGTAGVAATVKSEALRRYTIADLVDGGEAGLLERRTLHALWQKMPPLNQAQDWVLVYGMKQHGAALSTLMRRAAGIDTTLLVVKTTTGELFGGYATSAWAEKLEALGSATFFGRGDTHLYRLIQGSTGSAEATWFTWTREDHHFRAWQKHISQFHEAHNYIII